MECSAFRKEEELALLTSVNWKRLSHVSKSGITMGQPEGRAAIGIWYFVFLGNFRNPASVLGSEACLTLVPAMPGWAVETIRKSLS